MIASGRTYRGLPNANDHSKHKDFYAFFFWNYCSGKISNGTYHVNFCSNVRHSLYDLFSYWKVWGTNVHKEESQFYWLEQGPKLLYIPYIFSGGLVVLASLSGARSLVESKVSRSTLVFSSVMILSQ